MFIVMAWYHTTILLAYQSGQGEAHGHNRMLPRNVSLLMRNQAAWLHGSVLLGCIYPKVPPKYKAGTRFGEKTSKFQVAEEVKPQLTSITW
ncbi:hypothetical protein CONLIGDRAFT_628417 [Coniochaeta ligniaria NRRL 30616]|uniref:Secreted protein n=1 Tax=Coniochaeta ligniaria NRRL 30616 TaxID=1408157 RepID=A0A1J7K074_9PEZI|nr:hypothetical protein CONLIGDRAFT_628417 [Coniochaeta ligniaria NRRL 30616]